jgi:DNA mismatch repair protein MSH4
METSKISLKDNENHQYDNNTHFKRKKNNSSTSGVVVSEERCRVFQTPKQIKPSNTTAPNTLLATPSSFWNKYTSKSNDETGILDSADKVSNSHNNYQTPKLCTNPYANRTTSSLKSHYSRNNNNAYTPSSLSSSYHTAIKKGTTTNNNSKPESRIICTVSENLARETCIATIDLSSTSVLTVTKQGNGQTYAETMSFLEHIQPDEVLLNEGRRNSQLVKKIIELFQPQDGNDQEHDDDYIGDIPQTYTTGKHRKRRRKLNPSNKNINDKSTLKDTAKDMSGEPSSQTVVKFIPRSYFDQTKGAELLSRVCRDGFYDASVVEEYIFLSASYAILQYMQIFLGANFCRNTLTLELNWGGRNRMAIDRSTLMHLELLANAKTGKAKNSLIGTIDCTKTSVGSRLLRSNLMAPPTRVDTINARLELVQSFLEDEAFFYEVMEQLHALPDVDKMLAHMALIPREMGERRGKGKHEVTARMASRGISALVCIKSTLSVIPNFARVLEIQLKAYFRRENHQKNHGTMLKARTDDGNNDEGTEEDSSASSEDCYDEEINTCSSSLLLGLGSGPVTNNASVGRHELLKSILITMKQPALKEILDSVLDIFTESTSYTRNTHVMKHQECFALKPNTDGMMDVMRKALLANIDDIYKLADEYAEKFGFTVTVKETTARGYYLSIPAHAESNLPDIFIQPVKVGRFINCTTEQVSFRTHYNCFDFFLSRPFD